MRNGGGLWSLVGLEVAGTNQAPSDLVRLTNRAALRCKLVHSVGTDTGRSPSVGTVRSYLSTSSQTDKDMHPRTHRQEAGSESRHGRLASSGAFIRPPDPHRCFSDLPTAPQGPFKGPKPREAAHRDLIEPWAGPGPGAGLSPPPGATNGCRPRLACIFWRGSFVCPEKKVRAVRFICLALTDVKNKTSPARPAGCSWQGP